MTRDWNKLQRSYINCCHIQWFGEWSHFRESMCQQMLTQLSSSSDKMGISLSIWAPLTSTECLKQSQLQRDVGCQIQTQSGPSARMRLILIILKESHKLLSICSSAEQTILSSCDTSELREQHKPNVPTAPIQWQCLDSSNNSWDKGKNEACHTYLTSFCNAKLTNGKRGLFSKSLPPNCPITQQSRTAWSGCPRW